MIEVKDEIQEEIAEAEHEATEAAYDEGLVLGWSGRELRKRDPAKAFFRLLPQLPGFRWYAERVAPHIRGPY